MFEESPAHRSANLVVLLGHPVGHSLSPRLHNAAFRHQRLDFRYEARDVLPEGLRAAFAELRASHVRGANLTIPHKETALLLLDEITPQATLVGAVNTIVNDKGLLRGFNTDVDGFRQALLSLLPHGPAGLDCLVIGAGGAARATVAGLTQDGAAKLFIANRTPERAAALCEAAAGWGSATCVPLALRDVSAYLAEVHLVVNATSLGLSDSVKDFPFAVDTLREGQAVMDLVYTSVATSLVRAARAKGALAIDGREMLVQQAARSYRLWTGLEPPLDVMRESIYGIER